MNVHDRHTLLSQCTCHAFLLCVVSFQTLEKIRPKEDTADFHFEVITPERYDEVYEIMRDHFVPDEPICHGTHTVFDEDFKKLTHDNLKDHISLAMISKENNVMMGFRLSGFWKKTDPPANFDWMKSKHTKDLFEFVTHRDNDFNCFEMYGVEEIFHFYALGVRKEYRHHGLGDRLLSAALDYAKELGFKAVKGEGTGNYSQHIYEKHGFDHILEMPYDSYILNGEPIGTKTGEHRSCKIYGRKL